MYTFFSGLKQNITIITIIMYIKFMVDLTKLKEEIKKVGRKRLSAAINMPYFTLSLKLNGNLKLYQHEYDLIKTKLKELKNEQKNIKKS